MNLAGQVFFRDRTVREVAALLAKDHGAKETEAAQDSDQAVAV